MAIHSFLKVEKGDPDWQFSPERYFGKEFKLIDASTIELAENQSNLMVLRQNPTEKELLAKHLKINVKKDSNLDLIILNELTKNLQQIFLYDVYVEEGAGLNLGIFAKDGKFNKHIIQVYLENESEFNAYGLMSNSVGGDTEIITKIIHQHSDSRSNQVILGTADNESQTVFQGMTVLDKNSDGSEANIECFNMILDEKSRCHSKPDIYVDNNTVRSSLGCTTESLNPDKIYYLQSKGLDFYSAKNAIISSFQGRAIDIIPYEDIKEEVKQLFSG
jgi:Fe-S cluster assembly protein SufD